MPESCALRIERDIPGRIDDVFDAWLDPLALTQWMTPLDGGTAEADTDPFVGGRFRIVMKSAQTEIVHEGEYRVIARPRKLVFTWNSPYSENTLVTVEFASLSARVTKITLTHERFPDAETMESHRGGWGSILSALGRFAARRRGE